MTRDPARLGDPASGASDAVRELLRSSASDGPSAAQLQRLADKLAPQLGPPATSVTVKATSTAAKTGGFAKAIAVVVVVVAVAGYWFTRGAPTRKPAAPVIEPVVAAPTIEPPTPAPVEAVTAPARPPIEETATKQPPVRKPARPARVERAAKGDATATPSEDELAILGTAQRALVADDPRAALLAAERHAARFPSGLMTEEREAIAIEALVRLGRTDDASARFERFRTSYPRSSYRHRLERLLSNEP
jgi:hypothetical protein